MLISVIVIFLLDLGAQQYVKAKHGEQQEPNIQQAVNGQLERHSSHGQVHLKSARDNASIEKAFEKNFTPVGYMSAEDDGVDSVFEDRSFKQ